MKIPKPTEADKELFRSLLPADPRVEVKPMFGNLGAFVNGNMFAGLFGTDVGVKLPDADREQLLAAGGTAFGPAERPMPGYLTVPAPADPQWLTRAFVHVSGMPTKSPKTRRSKR